MNDLQHSSIRGVHWGLLALITAVGAWFRLYDLGAAALRADTIHFWSICQMPITGWQVITRWTELGVGQMPLPLAVTKWYIDLFGVDHAEFHLRLPNAMFGIALIPVMFAIGRRFFNVWTGLVAAALLALNPFHIQLSMEAYFYASLILGAGLMFLGALQAADALARNVPLARIFPWVSASGLILVAYSQVTGWVLAFLLIVAVLAMVWLNRKMHDRGMRDLYTALASYAVPASPLLIVSWGLPHMFEKLKDRGQIDFGHEVVEMIGDNAFTLLYRMATSMAWGETAPRILLLTLVFAAAVSGFVVMIRQQRSHLFIPLVAVAAYLLFLATRSAFGALYESRYLAGLLPIYLLFLSVGLAGPVFWFAQKNNPKFVSIGQCVAGALVIAALLGPAWASNQVTGKPTPYKEIVAIADRELTAGAPVLVDRWYEPWNELRVYPSTHVVFTFTVPNEPLSAFRQYRWRDTAIEFFIRNPDAAYLELAKTYHEVPDIGPWDWPRQFFARHISIRNEPGLRLRDWGVAARGDFYAANTNRVIVELFYNTRADVVERLAAAGTELFVFFDDGWRFLKSGPFQFLELQTEQLMEWRMMRNDAVLHLENLTSEPARVMVRVRAVAVNGPKHMAANDGFRKRFPGGGLEEWEIGPLVIAPGTTPLIIRDVQAGRADTRLLVERVHIARASEDQAD